MCIGVMYDRLHTRNIADYGGVVNVMPKFAAFMMLFGMANAGLPATSGFVGEFMVIMGAVKVNLRVGALAAMTLIYGASYTLWMYKRVIFGAIHNPHVAEMKTSTAANLRLRRCWRLLFWVWACIRTHLSKWCIRRQTI